MTPKHQQMDQLCQVIKQANAIGATVEIWTNGRVFIEAPLQHSWVKNDLHTLAYPTTGLNISEALSAGLKRCDDDCIFCSCNDSSFEPPAGTTFHCPDTELSLQNIIDEMDSLALVS